MLKTRIIPILLIDDTLQVVKPISFGRPYRRLGPIEQYIRVMEGRNLDEIVVLDITATQENRRPRADTIKYITSCLYCPVTYGGGISTLADIQSCLASGADKVAIASKAGDLFFVKDASEKFGAQAITTYIGIKNVTELLMADLCSYAGLLEQWGAGEILLTDENLDGTLTGPNVDCIRNVANAVDIPVVYAGGIRDGSDCLVAIQAGASAVAIGSAFLYTDETPQSMKEYLDEQGVPVRL